MRELLLAIYQSEPVNALQLSAYRRLPDGQGGRGDCSKEMSIA